MNNFQRNGVKSNAHAGKAFEEIAYDYFSNICIEINRDYSIELGFYKIKAHRFDLGGINNEGMEFVVECKSHKWTETDKTSSAKMTVWNEVMLYFSLLPHETEKILFVLKDYSIKRNVTLAEYYVRTYEHLIPKGAKIIEFDIDNSIAISIYG